LILHLWTSNKNSTTAREEVAAWAENYVADIIQNEGQDVTTSKVLQTAGTPVDYSYVTVSAW
jgi:hypothetical protein